METLGAKDGVGTPAEVAEPLEPVASGTVELGSRDLELQEIAPTPEEPPTHAQPKRGRKATRADEIATRAAPPPPDLLAAELAHGAPTRIARAGRWLGRRILIALVTLTAIGVGGYFALPHLPHWLQEPVHDWIRTLPPPIGAGQPAPPPTEPAPP
jgi:hypothetical protein